ncbi:DUF4148 domain-containing protein [Paraburkholderia sp.]|jgi:hypothetical protein|uniref:DUF4148 domain-containing protein n=1 Tax=Paraburkholderia sp. TaxID=1926495 RepID=UPI002F3F9F1C
MTMAIHKRTILAALALAFAGCTTAGMQAGGQTHLTATQCRDLTDIRNGAPVTRERNLSELMALEKAGYHPEWTLDPFYPEDLEAAQRQVNTWYTNECPQARAG